MHVGPQSVSNLSQKSDGGLHCSIVATVNAIVQASTTAIMMKLAFLKCLTVKRRRQKSRTDVLMTPRFKVVMTSKIYRSCRHMLSALEAHHSTTWDEDTRQIAGIPYLFVPIEDLSVDKLLMSSKRLMSSQASYSRGFIARHQPLTQILSEFISQAFDASLYSSRGVLLTEQQNNTSGGAQQLVLICQHGELRRLKVSTQGGVLTNANSIIQSSGPTFVRVRWRTQKRKPTTIIGSITRVLPTPTKT